MSEESNTSSDLDIIVTSASAILFLAIIGQILGTINQIILARYLLFFIINTLLTHC